MPYSDKDKERAFQRAWYHRNKQKRAETRRKNKKRVQAWFAELKKTLACQDCGETHPACITFHHVNPETKSFEISLAVAKAWGINLIKKEIEKCVVVCANCHGKKHWDERASRPSLDLPPRILKRFRGI